MERVRQEYSVGATLSLYDGWDKDRNLEYEDKIYKGPQKGVANNFFSKHAVIVFAFRVFNGVKYAL